MMMNLSKIFWALTALVRTSAQEQACATFQFYPDAYDCSGPPGSKAATTVPSHPNQNCFPYPIPGASKGSIGDQHCDMAATSDGRPAFKQIVYVGTSTCDESEAEMIVQQEFVSGACNSDPSKQTIGAMIVTCVAGPCQFEKDVSSNEVSSDLVWDLSLLLRDV